VANLLRLVFLVLSGTAIAFGMAVQQPEWAHQLGFKGQWGDQDQEFFPPDEVNQVIVQRIHEKEHITKDLLDGRLTLFEAATAFLRVDRQNPNATVHPQYVGFSKEEAACREVIQWARQYVQDRSPDAAARIIAHFEEELRRQKEQDKPLCL
jgi:hypothetical protein